MLIPQVYVVVDKDNNVLSAHNSLAGASLSGQSESSQIKGPVPYYYTPATWPSLRPGSTYRSLFRPFPWLNTKYNLPQVI